MAETIKEAIEENATDGLRKASGDSGSATKHSLPDQIAADLHLRGASVPKKRRLGMVFRKCVPPGTV